jgi:hypothetical protein
MSLPSCFYNMQLGDSTFAPTQLTAELVPAQSLESYDSTASTPLQLLILSWDQFVNELEFE